MALRSALINVMVRAIEKAGKALLRDFGEVEQLQVSRKGPKDFVTNADHKSEKILIEELGRARPTFGFWLEESGEINADRPERWLVDPLDGTSNFLHGLPFWAISVAAERDGDVIAGVIYEPVTDQMFWAEKGVGAFVNNQRLRVSARQEIGDSMVALGMSLISEAKDESQRADFKAIIDRTAGTRRIGSNALNMAYTAAGRFEGFWGNKFKPWDVAAGALMVREAGGLVTSLEGDTNPVYATKILASNYHLHQQFLGIMKAA
ncbi:MAG: inositol monophosphatase [Bdellovibrionales bacterium]